jgi:hypothetical protein
VYNNSLHASTRMTLFWAMYHWNPEIHFKAPIESHLKSESTVDATLEGLAETQRTLRENTLEVHQQPSKHAGQKDITFDMGDKVWLSTKHFRTPMPSMKLRYKHAGPYTVSKVINRNTYKLDLPKMMWNHNVFHVSQLDR